MQVFVQLVTFTTTPVALAVTDDEATVVHHATRVFVEPASGTHVSYVEKVGVATSAGDATLGVIKRLAAYASTGILDHWEITDQKGGNLIDLSQYQFDGTAGEKLRVTVYVA